MAKQDQLTRTRRKKVRTLLKSGRLVEACKLCEKLCAGKGADAETWLVLGDIQSQLGNFGGASASFHRTLAIDPDNADACSRLGDMLLQQNDPEQAAAYYGRAVQNRPGDPKLLTNYAALLTNLHRPSEAEPWLRSAIKISPKLPEPYTNLGGCLKAQGKTDEALACYELGLRTAADDAMMHSNALVTRHYVSDQDPGASLDAHRAWAKRHTVQAAEFSSQYPGDPDPNRKLRIAYVSPDFRAHSVAYFLDPLLENHNSGDFEIYCYADVARPDEMTRRLRRHQSHWRDTSQISDSELDRRIRSDKIDILVDLAGHTAGNRLKVFARKAAPIQVTWLGYPDTTGLDVMDYRISDLHADPPGFEAFYTEELVRLEGCFLCYRPPADAPAVAPSPCEQRGAFTFGSFNNLAKINCRVVELWATILQRIPAARLLIKNPGLTDPAVRDSYNALFQENGIDPERISLRGLSASTRDHLAEYQDIDIALDTFPYNGTTTTCEALWMGVPVLTLTGNTHASRVGSSLLSAVGLKDWITSTADEYVAQAVAAASDCDEIVQARINMRQRLRDSVLCNGSVFTARLESAYRAMWLGWCNGRWTGTANRR